MKKSFRTKVIAVFLIGIVLSMLFMTFLSTIFLRPIFIANSKKMMENYAKTLEMSRLESDGYKCDMEQVFSQEIFEIIKRKTEMEYPDVSFCMDCQNVPLYCNKLLISRAVLNFVKNAVKYREKESAIFVNGKSENGNYVFQVVNKGAGIPEKEREMIWDLFYKNDCARKRDKSHGIGLSMVSQIAKLHGGEVGVVCEDGKIIFSMRLAREKYSE